ncbi:RNA polymerase beta subunit [Klebsiella phage vB_KpM_FBKp24]|uniref:Virion structural protein n=1 Tax=Klebsiella phage vB_KpM_FBKp24 TaxID=2801834 RepID=A0A7U0GBF3_9CAUD|nr:hypothetical protein [Klebsiella pneumoniae]YP_010298977.1 RNA polymerase beta subunit [Klebsiella phage vB_KpM_FBKp24]QQV92117.1 virion structural protein [Klebsiella phage vB_KpM_FBKp24]
MKNRAAATAIGVRLMEELFPGSGNATQLAKDLESLSDTEFDKIMEGIREGRPMISATLPNLTSPVYDNAHLKAVAERWGVQFWHHLEMEDPETKKIFTTPVRYMVIREGVIRLQQMIEDKQSIPDDNTHVDDLTGQVTGPSKGSRISFPELSNLESLKMDVGIIELISVRGGDEAANQKLESDISLTGEGTVQNAKEWGTGVTATKNFATLLRTAHLDTTLDK